MNNNFSLFQNEEFIQILNKKEELDKVNGLQLIDNFISIEEEQHLLSEIGKELWITDLKRRVQHYGYKYDYRARRINLSMQIGGLPEWGNEIAKRLSQLVIFKTVPDQLIVNEYKMGQGITSHTDCEPCFDNTIVSISLGSTAIMNFSHNTTNEKVEVFLNQRSAIILKGESRYDWKHGIVGRKKDKFQGKIIPRKLRVSLTFRNVILK